MKKVRFHVSLNLVGCQKSDDMEYEDDASDEEIDEDLRDWMHDQVEYYFETIKD